MLGENYLIYVLFIVGSIIIVAKVPGIWEVVKSISGTIKTILEVLVVSSFDWFVFLFKLVWKSHKSFLYNLFNTRETVLPKERFEEANRRGGA
mgnify:CR=1 FL=1